MAKLGVLGKVSNFRGFRNPHIKMTAGKEKEKVEDVEMKDAEEEKVEKKDPNLLSVEDVREHCKLIRRSVETKEVTILNCFPFATTLHGWHSMIIL